MTEYTYDSYQKLTNITTDELTPDVTERLLNVAIGLLNIFGADLSTFNGDSGSKTMSCENHEWAAIAHITKMVYADFYEDSGGDMEVSGITVEARNYLGDPKVMNMVRDIAQELHRETTSPYDDIILF